MRIAVVQHASPDGEPEAIVAVVRAALEQGADLIVCPAVPSEAADAVSDALDRVMRESSRAAYLLPTADGLPAGSWNLVPVSGAFGQIGSVVILVSDACFDVGAWEQARDAGATVAVLCPLSESELQSEAALEVAIALSDSLCGLVVVAEATGAPAGVPGHGGSAIVMLGGVSAEALADTDVLLADVLLPIASPEPPEPLPKVPTLLSQRLSRHSGRKPDVTYLADLSDGPGTR